MELLADRYELREPLGSGGMSRVIAAHDRVLHRRVAVKLLRDDLAEDPTVPERLLREARAAASFTHPNAVAVFDVGERTTGQPFIVMELIEGRTLAQELRERGSLPIQEALRIADGILAALEAAHARGHVHRDVKPANILLAADGHAKLADFGIAKGLQEAAGQLTGTGQVLGTPRYLAPERAAGRPTDARSDLYALGVVLYEMLAGAPPFSGDNPLALAVAHQRTPVPPLAERRPEVPAWVATAVERALEKDPEGRFSSAAELRAALRNHRGEERAAMPVADPDATITDERDTLVRTLERPERRPRWAAVAIVAVAAVAAALVVVAALLTRDDQPTDPAGGEVAGEAGADAAPGPDEAAEEPPEAAGDDAAGPVTGEPDAARASLEEALAELRENPEAGGDRADNLEGGLEDVLNEEGPRLNREARGLMSDIEEWVDEGRLDPDLGERVIGLLQGLIQ